MRSRGRRSFSRRGLVAIVAATTVVTGAAVALAATQPSVATADTHTWYVLVNRNSGKVLDDYAFATNDGAAVVQWARHGGANQQWRFIDAGGGYYRLQNRNSGKVLDDPRSSQAAGTALVLWSDHNGSNQQFQLAESPGGYVRLINRSSGMAADVSGASTIDGGKLIQFPDRGGANQQWQLVAVGSVDTPVTTGGGTTTPTPSTTPSSSTSSPTAGGTTTSPAPSSTPSSSSPAAGGGGSAKTFLGSSTVLIGGSMSDASMSAAPFDLQYSYIHSQPAPTSAAYTAARCDSAWSGWWGCWTGPTTAPGTQLLVRQNAVDKATYQGKAHPQRIVWTWYSMIDVAAMAGYGEGPDEAKVLTRADLLGKYLDDYRFFVQKIGTRQDLIDLEPDFWGFTRTLGNLHQVPAQVSAANPTDCGSQENSAAGLARCMIAMTRKYAPHAGVGLHLSCFDWQSNLTKCKNDYVDLGAGAGDYLVSDITDRDAGWYALPAHGSRDTFWTDQKAATALAFYKAMSEAVGKPIVLWQIPVGNMAQNNTPGHYQDDKVDWLFSHMSQVAAAHIGGLLFGAGWSEQTTPETDGGNLINKTIAYRNSGGVALQ